MASIHETQQIFAGEHAAQQRFMRRCFSLEQAEEIDFVVLGVAKYLLQNKRNKRKAENQGTLWSFKAKQQN